jgi:hypothetical protein
MSAVGNGDAKSASAHSHARTHSVGEKPQNEQSLNEKLSGVFEAELGSLASQLNLNLELQVGSVCVCVCVCVCGWVGARVRSDHQFCHTTLHTQHLTTQSVLQEKLHVLNAQVEAFFRANEVCVWV